jgi:hypothetical protein
MEDNKKEYSIMSFADLCDVITPENKDRLLADVVLAFNGYVKTITEARKMFPELAKDMKNSDIAEFGFTWYDDGKNEVYGTTIEGPDGMKAEFIYPKKV